MDFQVFAYGYSISSVTFVESLSLLHWIALYFDKAIVLCLGSISVLPLRIEISNPLDFYVYSYALTTLTWLFYSKSLVQGLPVSTFVFLFKIILAALGPLHFHICFRIRES